MDLFAVLGGWIGDWRPGIGDPTPLGWLTVAAYFAAAWCCVRARTAARGTLRPAATGGSVRVWTVLALGLVVLGVNKQLDLQSAVTAFGRETVRRQGWEPHRETLQRGFVVAVVVLAVVCCAGLAVLARREWRRVAIALVGWTALCVFVGVRAASFHHVDHLLGVRWAGASLNVVFEVGGIAVVAVGALTYRRTPP